VRRRFFLKVSAGIAGAEWASTGYADETTNSPSVISHKPPSATIVADRKMVQEAPRRTPVAADVDVLVVGGGPTGVGAALAAASEGAKTLVVERHGMLGGMWTAGLLNPLFDSPKGWWVEKLIRRLREAKAWRTDAGTPVFDTEMMKVTLERMLEEAHVEFWYHVQAVDPLVAESRVQGILVEGKSGREAILAKGVVDCTGDGDIAARAGVPFQLGRKIDGLSQPMTLMFEVTNIERFEKGPASKLGIQNMLKALKEAIEKNNLSI